MTRMNVLLTIVLALGVLIGATRVASANPVREYRDVMQAFVPDIRGWSSQTQGLIDAAVAKPELGCSLELAELVRQGRHASRDLAGTEQLAPATLRGAHRQVTAAVTELAAAGELACGNEVEAAARAEQAQRKLNLGLAPIQQVLGGPGRAPETTTLGAASAK